MVEKQLPVSGSRKLDCDEITQVTRRRRLEELICSGSNLVEIILYSMRSCILRQCRLQRIENTVRIGGPGSCNNSTSKSIIGVL